MNLERSLRIKIVKCVISFLPASRVPQSLGYILWKPPARFHTQDILIKLSKSSQLKTHTKTHHFQIFEKYYGVSRDKSLAKRTRVRTKFKNHHYPFLDPWCEVNQTTQPSMPYSTYTNACCTTLCGEVNT